MPNEFGFTAQEIIQDQRTEKGIAFERKRAALQKIKGDERKRLNASILKIRAVGPSAVHANTILSNMSVQYANDEYIGVQLMPVTPVPKRSDAYAIYTKRDRLAYPDDSLTSRARASEITESRSTDNYSVKDYGYSNFVSADTIENEDGAFDEMLDLQLSVDEGIAFREELRIAAVLTNTANFASGNNVTLSGTSTWDQATSNPIKDLQAAGAALWSGRGPTRKIAYCSLDVFNVLARNPSILDLFKYVKDGLATRQQIAGFFGWDDLLIGAARQDTANSGQTASYGRIWGKYFGLVRAAQRPTLRSVQFGASFRLRGDPIATQWYDPAVGKGGGYYYRSALSEDHKVIANDAGYLIAGAIS